MARSKKKVTKKKKVQTLKGYSPEHFFNREISWLEFNARVLNEARDTKTPLLERVRFLSIFTSNLDEFVMKRIGGLKAQIESNYITPSLDGLYPEEQLEIIRRRIIEDNIQQEQIYREIKKELLLNNIQLCHWNELDQEEIDFCREFFIENIYPVLTPLSVDAGRPFPFISNLSYSFGVYIENPISEERTFSRVKVPGSIHQWIELPFKEGVNRLINTAQIIENNLEKLYYGMKVLYVMPFRVTRNADWEHDDEDTEDLLELIEESIKERRLQDPIRLECLSKSNPEMLSYLMESMQLEQNDLYLYEESFDYLSLASLCELDKPQLKHVEWRPVTYPYYQRQNIFDLIQEEDRLIHHPYENFKTTVEKFIVEASNDSNVMSIKMTLYRTEENSPLIKALIDAAENGIQVVCLIELKARFDEKRNIQWAKKMEEAGVHVVYGIPGLKTHSKVAMVVRRESNGKLLRYVHIGTGNYNSKTARLYTDFGIFTTNPKITHEISEVFNYLTGTSLMLNYKHLLVSPVNAKSKFVKLIEEQEKKAVQGKRSEIIAKMNSLEDPMIIEALYRASQAGVSITLIVRGFCCIKPNVPGLSENIRVISIVGRYLEHSRIYYFANGENEWEGKFFIGSADWMHRNLHARVEVLTPIYSSKHKEKIRTFLEVILEDKVKSWILKQDGSYIHNSGSDETCTHDRMMHLTQEELKKMEH